MSVVYVTIQMFTTAFVKQIWINTLLLFTLQIKSFRRVFSQPWYL